MQTTATKFPLMVQLESGPCLNKGQQLQSATEVRLIFLSSSVPTDMKASKLIHRLVSPLQKNTYASLVSL